MTDNLKIQNRTMNESTCLSLKLNLDITGPSIVGECGESTGIFLVGNRIWTAQA